MSGRIMHAPAPGPLYWDWRCVRCSQPVSDHASWLHRLLGRRSTDVTS